MKKILLLLLICFAINSCEKDDICDPATPTTPKLVINFYDAITNAPKLVNNLKVIGDGMTDGIAFTTASDATKYLATGVNTIKIPLKNTADITKYHLILNYGNTAVPLPNEDILEFKYSRTNVYISRACGYKTIFALTAAPLKTDAITPDGFWIQSIIVSQPNINEENETHIKIYFN
jgi:hypothetical protein